MIMKWDCGCEVETFGNGGHLRTPCRLHSAAPDLLAACEYAYNYVSKLEGLRGGNKRQQEACGEVLYAAITKTKESHAQSGA